MTYILRRIAFAAAVMLGLVLIGSAHGAPAKSSHDDSEAVQANEEAWAKAAVDGDADRMASYMADEYLELGWEQAVEGAPAHWSTTTKTEWVESVRSRKEVYTSVELHNLVVHVQGNLAVVTGEYSQKGTSNGKDISASGIYANTWEKRRGRWVVVHSVFP